MVFERSCKRFLISSMLFVLVESRLFHGSIQDPLLGRDVYEITHLEKGLLLSVQGRFPVNWTSSDLIRKV